jgi:hypothetical protein
MLGAFNAAFTRLSGRPFDSPAIPAANLRARIVRFGKDGYVCLYQVGECTVLVARLFHAREDWQGSK